MGGALDYPCVPECPTEAAGHCVPKDKLTAVGLGYNSQCPAAGTWSGSGGGNI